MTYSNCGLSADLTKLALRMEFTPREHMNRKIDCAGRWILQTALGKTEAGDLFALGAGVSFSRVSKHPWLIKAVKSQSVEESEIKVGTNDFDLPDAAVQRIADGLRFEYANIGATTVPSKQTATQLKGRSKDNEAAEYTVQKRKANFRKPSFIEQKKSAAARGTAVHMFMQFANFEQCKDLPGIHSELKRMVNNHLLSAEQAEMVDCNKILPFFTSEMGKQLCAPENNILREFKFSLLVDADRYYNDVSGEKLLLQGVVDCAWIRSDGITVIDFKTDYVDDKTGLTVVERYRAQIQAYCEALEKIYQLPVRDAYLYLFSIGQFVKV